MCGCRAGVDTGRAAGNSLLIGELGKSASIGCLERRDELFFKMSSETSTLIAETISQGGRKGRVETRYEGFNLDFSPSSEQNPQGLTPEHLFGAAWAACFHGAILMLAEKSGHKLTGSTVTARVKWNAGGEGKPFDVELLCSLPGLDEGEARKVVDDAEKLCAYSNATRGKVGFKVTLN